MKSSVFILSLSFLVLISCNNSSDSSLSVPTIKCNGMANPEGTGMIPRFSWIIESASRGQEQTAYQLIISSDEKNAGKNNGDIWDSGKTISGSSAWISYNGPQLQPATKYFWKVRVWDKNDKPSKWSTTGEFLTGLFEKK